VLELDFEAVKFLFFPRRDLNSIYIYYKRSYRDLLSYNVAVPVAMALHCED